MGLKSALTAGALSLTLASYANAGVIVTTTTGTLTGRDGIGLFAASGTELNGLEYTFTFRYSRELNGAQDFGEDYDWSWGGGLYSAVSAPFQMTLSAAGRQLSILSLSEGIFHYIADGQPAGNPDTLVLDASGWNGEFSTWLSTTVVSKTDWISAHPKLGQKSYLMLSGDDQGENGLRFYKDRGLTVDPVDYYSYLSGTITSVSMYEESAEVPEPTSIALLTIGLIGAASARRRKSVQQ